MSLPWNNGTNAAPVVSAGPGQTVTLPGSGVLNGSVSDDGLPLNGTLTMSWTKVSGPGNAIFEQANQAVTSVTFTLAGTYVLQLSASDGALSAPSTVTVTAVANTNWSSGWIASPLDKSPVNGLVPVTLISGITLTGGYVTFL